MCRQARVAREQAVKAQSALGPQPWWAFAAVWRVWYVALVWGLNSVALDALQFWGPAILQCAPAGLCSGACLCAGCELVRGTHVEPQSGRTGRAAVLVPSHAVGASLALALLQISANPPLAVCSGHWAILSCCEVGPPRHCMRSEHRCRLSRKT